MGRIDRNDAFRVAAQRARAHLALGHYLRLPGPHVVHVDPVEVERVCADPDDDIFLGAAVEGNAAYLIAGNTRHFARSPWRGIRIVEPARFVQLLSP